MPTKEQEERIRKCTFYPTISELQFIKKDIVKQML